MRIERIEIGAFGPLRGVSLSLDKGPVTLMYGPNEAGKSTVLEFIRALLFGFQSKGGAGRYAPDPAVIQGGRLILKTGDGERFAVERWDRAAEGKGRPPAAGHVRVLYPDGSEGGERELSGLLGGMTPDVFRHVFAFGLTELQELGTLQHEEVSGFLYSAGLGVSGSAIRMAQRKLTQELEQLYRPRGRTPLINQALLRLAEAEERLRASKRQSEKYETLLLDERTLTERCEALEAALAELQRKNDELERLRQARPHAVRYGLARSELEELPEALELVAEDVLAREEALEAERERLASERDLLTLQSEETEAALAALSLDAAGRLCLLEQRQELEALHSRLAAYEETVRQQSEAAAETAHQRSELEGLLRRIGPGWTAAALEELPPIVLLKEEVSLFREEGRAWKQEQAALDGEHRRIRQELEAAEPAEELAAGRESGQWNAAERIGVAQRLLADWKEAQRELRHAGQRLHDLERLGAAAPEREAREEAGKGRLAPLLLAAAAVVLPAALLAAGEPVAAAVALALTAAGLALELGSRRLGRKAGAGRAERGRRLQREAGAAGGADAGLGIGPLEAHAAGLEARLGAELAALARAGFGRPAAWAAAGAGALPLPPEDIEPWLDALERQLRAGEARLAARREAEQRLAALEDQAARHARAGEPRAARWRDWLRAHALPEAASPDAALELLALAEAALAEQQRLRRLEARLSALAGEAAAFAAAAQQLLGPEAAAAGAGAALRARQLELRRALEREAEAAQLRARQDELRRKSALLAQQAGRVAERAAELYAAAGAADGPSLRRRCQQAQRRRELAAAARQEAAALRALLGEAWERALPELGGEGGFELDQAQAAVDAARDEQRRSLEEAREARGRMRFELERLAEGSQHAEALQLVEECRAEVLRLTGQWAVHALCQQLLTRTKSMFEQDKQPSVMRRASASFSRLTAGKYTRILSPIGEQRVLAELADGQLVETAKLSRGTAEQMYISIRFALIDEYAAAGVRLPMIIDDLFVNFDDERLMRGLELLGDVSERGQLLLFTCHQHVLQAYAGRFPSGSVVRLPAPGKPALAT
ncbi:Uncharacterized protein YhaN [Paenibacillus sp. UNCCL117]|uniref:AAA family ATPase n=1 Tax=unclassified Paenibacillus TaxID=185978 RepID=UPI00088064A4|nr:MULTISPECIES: AAA family ATPase [unclassified Paenibacillus]SDC24698.1 Uncharacterized protein YhaN [Paenibacillus sp. cl123]SFW19636.1 Uncharacterized protein YhaN [Paenibacillus sp. UNCCL117]